MNQGTKRFRQTSILESFAFNKKPKSTHMEQVSNNQEQSVTNSSINNSSECQDNLRELDNICQAVKNAAFKKPSLSPLEQLQNTNETKVKKENCEITAKASTSIIDQLWGIDDTEVEDQNLVSAKSPVLNEPVIDESNETDDGSYRSSADLFPEEPSVEDNSVPSTSNSQELYIDSQKELFESQSPSEEVEVVDSSSDSDEADNVKFLNRSPACDMPLPELEPSENHTIMFSPHIRPGDAPRPYPKSYRDKWDSDHVRMPCSPLNKYPVENSMGESVIGSRWELICRSLTADIGSSKDLENAIMRYNRQHIDKWNFAGLHYLINKHWREEEREHFFDSILPDMIQMALNLPNICTQPVPLLKQNKDHYVTLSQKQIACLMLNAFFCTFPRRNPRSKKQRWNSEYVSYPDINLNRLFFGTKHGPPRANAEKLKCLFNYFRRIIAEEPSGTVTFHRQVISPHALPNWYSSTRGLRTVVVKSKGFIENEGHGLLQVDFANRFIGGGVFGQGCVQEEIRFAICPELIISRLFVESLESNEALIIIGAEQYNKYSGYGDTFTWEGDFRDNTPRDSWGRQCTKIVAIDAIAFRKTEDQFTCKTIKRELNKAYCGFYENAPPTHLSAIATGNWGCGAFRGSANLKFLIQLMAASECGRSLLYFTFHNKKLKKELQKMYEFLSDKNLTVGDLWRLLIDYTNHLISNKTEKKADLYNFIYSQFTVKNSRPKEDKNTNELTDSFKNAAELLFEELTKDTQDSNDIT